MMYRLNVESCIALRLIAPLPRPDSSKSPTNLENLIFFQIPGLKQ